MRYISLIPYFVSATAFIHSFIHHGFVHVFAIVATSSCFPTITITLNIECVLIEIHPVPLPFWYHEKDGKFANTQMWHIIRKKMLSDVYTMKFWAVCIGKITVNKLVSFAALTHSHPQRLILLQISAENSSALFANGNILCDNWRRQNNYSFRTMWKIIFLKLQNSISNDDSKRHCLFLIKKKLNFYFHSNNEQTEKLSRTRFSYDCSHFIKFV